MDRQASLVYCARRRLILTWTCGHSKWRLLILLLKSVFLKIIKSYAHLVGELEPVCVWGTIKAAGTCLGGSLVQKNLANKLIFQMLLVNVYICTVFGLRLTKVRMKQCLTLRSFHFPLQRRCCALWCSHSISEH